MAQRGGTPVLILREGSERTRGKDAQSRNIMAAKTIANAVKSTLGPKGMDKMLVDSMGDAVITRQGASTSGNAEEGGECEDSTDNFRF